MEDRPVKAVKGHTFTTWALVKTINLEQKACRSWKVWLTPGVLT